MENMENRATDGHKPNIFERLFFRRRTSSSGSEPMVVGSPPMNNDNLGGPQPRNRCDSEGVGMADDPEMKFANPNEAIPMPWK